MGNTGASRAAAILGAVQREVMRRRALLDESDDLHTVTITVKLVAGTAHVRGTVWEEERLSPDGRVPRPAQRPA